MAKKTKKKSKAKKPKTQKPVVETPQITPHPTAGARVIDFEALLDKQIAGEIPEPKRGPGRPRKEDDSVATEEDRIRDDIVRAAVCVPFDMWSRSQKLPELKLTREEAAMLIQPVRTLLDYYLVNVPEIAIAWACLAVTAYTITCPRLDLISVKREKQKPPCTQPAANSPDKNKDGDQGRSRQPAVFPRVTEIKPVKIE